MRRAANKNAGPLISAREPFQASNFAGRIVRFTSSTGRLEGEERQRHLSALQDATDAGTQLYVVYSYATPIAWTPATGPASWTVTRTRHSVSTTRHAGIIRATLTHSGADWTSASGNDEFGAMAHPRPGREHRARCH